MDLDCSTVVSREGSCFVLSLKASGKQVNKKLFGENTPQFASCSKLTRSIITLDTPVHFTTETYVDSDVKSTQALHMTVDSSVA